jgi:hypothetical protein
MTARLTYSPSARGIMVRVSGQEGVHALIHLSQTPEDNSYLVCHNTANCRIYRVLRELLRV